MTRSLIVTLRTISPGLRRIILSRLFESNYKFKELPNFEQTEFALQENMPIKVEKIRKIPNKYLVSITTDSIIEDWLKYRDPTKFDEVKFSSRIKPDAWIFNNEKTPQFCFLIECKTIGDVLKTSQIIQYAKYFYGIDSYEEMESSLIRITWYHIVDICTEVLEADKIGNQQEKVLLLNLIEYLKFCHVIRFAGFDFGKVPDFPEYKIGEYIDFGLSGMPNLPNYEISMFIDFGLGRTPTLPDYKIR